GRFGDRRRPRALQGEMLGRDERDRGRPRVRAARGSTGAGLDAHRPPLSFVSAATGAGPAAVAGSYLQARTERARRVWEKRTGFRAVNRFVNRTRRNAARRGRPI